MINKTRIFRNLITFLCVAVVIIPGVGHAAAITREKVVYCNPEGEHNKNAIRFAGNPRHQYILSTNGIRVSGKEGLLTNWRDGITEYGIVSVHAYCVPTSTKIPAWMFPTMITDTSLPVLTCAKGEGIFIDIITPECPGPSVIRYFGDLTRLEDEDEREPGVTLQQSQAEIIHGSDISSMMGLQSPVVTMPHPQSPPITVSGSGLL